MELKQLTEETFKIFDVNSTKKLKNKLFEVCKKNETQYLKKFKELVKDLSIDWLQKIFQYYEADRENKGQDYTPKCLAKLVSKLSQVDGKEECLDMCCGSGALTIQKWLENPKMKFKLEEFDENVIPFLIFNMMLRNIDANIEQKDVLEDKVYHSYKIIPCDEFGRLEVIK